MTRAISLWGPVLLYMAVIFHASSQPDVPLPPELGDKPTHSIAYSLLGLLIVRALGRGLGSRITIATALLGVALTTAYGITDEVHQMFVPGRYADWNDLAADAIGGVIGTGIAWAWGIIAPARADKAGRQHHGRV